MTQEELLDLCAARGIVLRVEADQLKVRAAKGTLDEPTRRLLQEYKAPLVQWLSNRQSRAQRSHFAAIPRASREGPLPASLAQQRLWFVDQLDGGGAAYHLRGALRLHGALDRTALRRSLDTILARHEALRTTFVQEEGEVRQIIDNDAHFALLEVDLSELAATEREAQLAQHESEEALERFDLMAGPMIRGRLLRVSADEHVLYLTIHHIVADGSSVAILLREISALYAAYRAGQPDPLSPLPIQYADYAIWQRQWLQGAALQQQIEYWKQQLTGAPALLELPTDRTRPTAQRFRGESFRFALDADLCARLKSLARQHDATLFMALYAGLATVLSRLSGQDEVVIGVPVANRQRAEVEALIGFFVNMLPLRVQISEDDSVAELLRRVRGLTLDAYSHQDIPFEQVVEIVQPPRSLSHSPIFQVGFSWMDGRQHEAREEWLPGLRIAPQTIVNATARFDLSWLLQEVDAGIVGSVHYASDVFDRATIERWVDHFRHVLNEMARDAQRSVGALTLLDAAESRRLLREFNAATAEYPRDAVIHQLFEAQAQRTPEALAAVYEDQQLTFRDLDRSSNQLARFLHKAGVRPRDRVVLCVERGLTMIVGLLGILKAGGAHVPVDPDYPEARLAAMLVDSAPRALLTQQVLAPRLPLTDTLRIFLDSDWSEIAQEDGDTLDPGTVDVRPTDPAYVIYTSGSTGQPKGVVVAHTNVVHLWKSLEACIYRGSCHRVTVNASLSFDASVKQWVQLLSGRTLVLLPASIRTDEKAWLSYIARHRAEGIDVTPSQLRTLIEAGLLEEAEHSPKLALVGGEAIDPGLWSLLAASRATRFFNVYGPTECTVDATATEIDSSAALPVLGRPIPNVKIYILDRQGRPVAIGVTGEIHIGGAGVAQGYLNDAVRTDERFPVDPFSDEANTRMYRTGDLGRWRADGSIVCVGRNDSQVKVRGFRIELGEIEARLANCAGVREVAVLAREDIPGEKRLVAYYCATEAGPDVEELRGQMREQLPEYMLPVAYVRLERLPLTPNGKTDRKALPAPEMSALPVQQYVAPEGELEAMLATIWQDLLQVPRVGRRDNFFALGGHSLMTIRLIGRVRKLLGRQLTLQSFFDNPTIQSLATFLSAATAVTTRPIERADRSRPLPLSLAQQRLWFIEQLGGAGSAYYLGGAVRLKGTLDFEALQAALNAVVRRHEVLRTVFRNEAGQPAQVILPDARFALAVEDLRSLGRDERDSRLPRFIEQEANRAFDLGSGPLIRARLFRLDRADYILFFTAHHLVADGWSIGVLIRELSELYSAQRESRPAALAAPRTQYADYAQWQREWLTGEVLQSQLDYWKQHLQGAPALLNLPTDRARPPLQSHAGATLRWSLGRELTEALKLFARRFDSTLYMVLVAAWALLLSRLSGQRDVVIGTPVANRQRPEVEGLIGFFVNTLALRMQLNDESTVADLLKQVRATTLAGYAHQEVPFEQVVEAIQPPRSLSHGALTQVMFAFQNMPHSELVLPGLRLTPERVPRSGAQFDLTLALQDEDGEVAGGINYATALFDADTIERWSRHYQTVLESMVQDSAQALNAVPLLKAQEQRHIVESFNVTARAYPTDTLVHQLFEDQAALTPTAAAVTHRDELLTYAQLNERANRLAHHLRSEGVQPDTRVGICVQRGTSMVVGLMAILKAGGAYVPLDPVYPANRLQYLLKDSGPLLLLVDAVGREALAGATVPMLDLQADTDRWAALSAENPRASEAGLTARHLAYVIYTSGSTGEPKGVTIEHRNTANFIHWARETFSATTLQQTLFSTSLNFDLAVYECFVPLSMGASLRVVGSALDLMQETPRITLINTVPSAMKALLDASAPLPQTLHTVNLAGEALKAELVERIFADTPAQVVCNLYGPSETTTYSTWVRMERSEGFVQSIGRPIANTQVHILDPYGHPAPIGVEGELYIGGAGVARGYLNRPALTAERFVRDPFSSDPSSRMYRTGDVARYRPDGTIEFLGRNDHQVKLRGYRIELGEIESRLARHASVKEAAVLALEDASGEKRLVAYVVPSDATAVELDVEQLRFDLQQQLPQYMVPSAVVRLDALPLTPNGKLDRQALPAPEGNAGHQRAYEAPEGETEQKLAQIWKELLRAERVGRHDNFFELGGHSLLAVTLIERMRQQGLSTDIRALFSVSTLWELASQVDRRGEDIEVPANLIPVDCQHLTTEMLPLIALTQEQIDRIVDQVPRGAANVQDIYPLAPLQEGILFHHLATTEGDAYVISSLLAFDTRDRLDRVLGALQKAIDRNDILRTAVLWEGLPEPVQVVWREARLIAEEVDLRAEPGEAANSAERLLQRFDPSHFRLDVRRAPLQRAIVAFDAAENRWLLLWLSHHLSLDHVSRERVLAEVQAHLLGESEQLSAPSPFRQFVAQARGGLNHAEHERFFRQTLRDIEEPTAPFGSLDGHAEGAGIAEIRVKVQDGVSGELRARARAAGINTATLFHLAWAQVLARLTGREEVVFGTVLSGRLRGGSAADHSIGLFINTLPLRVSVGEQCVRDAVRQTQDRLGELLRHEHASLALAQRCSSIPPPAPLFTTLLNFRHSHVPGAAESERKRRAFAGIQALRGQERTHYPVTLSIDDLGEGFALTAQVAGAIDPSRVCELMHSALEALVRALGDSPTTPVRDIDILTASERARLLVEWNGTAAGYPSDQCVHQLFEAQAERTPNAAALMYEDRSLTYAELNAKANQLAQFLRARGIGPDRLVGICVERSFEMVIGLLGILKAGGAYVPMDPGYPAERLADMLSDAAPAVVLTQRHLRECLPVTTSELVSLDSDWHAIAALPPTSPRIPDLESRHLAYVIYTSGSTGRPKGAMNEHRGVVNRLVWMQNAYRMRPQDRVLQKTSFSFDVSAWEFFWTLMSGACLVIARPDGHKDPAYLRDLIEQTGITTLHFVPSMLQHFVEFLRPGECSSLRHVVCSGEELPASLQRKCFASLPYAQLSNLYGPTEAAIDVTAWECAPDDTATRVPIGRPISNIQIYVLDRYQRPAPLGVAGELYIAGVGVGRGYLNRPELTAERFLHDPFASDPEARMYKTGDLARWRPDGALDYLGRNDHQVKIRGFRIELGEIEAQLTRHPNVREAVVLAREDAPGEKRLIAYYVPRDRRDSERALDLEMLRAHLGTALPDYMIPSAFIELPQLPLTANGKLDRSALPAPEQSAYTSGEYAPPQGEVEVILATIWQDLLQIRRVGRQDHFFTLGGHSLRIVQLLERLRRVGLNGTVQQVFEHPVLRDLASAIATTAADVIEPAPPHRIRSGDDTISPDHLTMIDLTREQIDRIVATVPGGSANVQDIYPLAPLQEGILFHHLMSEQGDAYVLSMLLELQSREDLDALVKGLQAVIDRHDILRSAVLWEGLPRPLQVVYRHAPLIVEEIALERSADPQEEMKARMAPQRLWIDVGRAPLFRLQIAPTANGTRWYALLQQHHLINDHVGQGILLSELKAGFAGRSAELAQPMSYRSFVWQALVRAGRGDSERFFRGKLGDVEEPTLPFGLVDVHGDGHEVEQAAHKLDAASSQRVREQARRLGVTPAALFHAAWALVVARTSGRDDVVFGSVLLGRMHGDIGRVMGMFINTLPLRIDLRGRSAEQLVRQVQRELVELLRHEQASLVLAQRCSGVSGSMPLFSAVLNYRHSVSADRPSSMNDRADSLGIQLLGLRERSNYPFLISVTDSEAGFDLVAQTDRRIDPKRVTNYLQVAMTSLLEALAQRPLQSAVSLDVLPENERHQLLREFNATSAPYPAEVLIHELVEAQAHQMPEAPAVSWGTQRLSHGELNRRANRLARYLREHGAGPDQPVALCVTRGLDMVVGALAILKAGAAYVPLDPGYPAERLAYMLEDAGAQIVLTQASQQDTLPPTSAHVIVLDGQRREWEAQEEADLPRSLTGVTPTHLAYVIYTSGSTGRPKGVMVEHRSLANLIHWHRKVFDGHTGHRTSCLAGLGFDATVWEIWPTLSAGGELVLPPQTETDNLESLLEWWRRQRLDISFLPTPAAEFAFSRGFGNQSLRTLLVGGDQLRHRPRPPIGYRLINNYGLTETTVVATSACLEASEPLAHIGRPISNTQVYILDAHLQPVPVGVAGEIYIGGVGVARGYLNQPELTRKRFVPDPFSSAGEGRLYRTGDLGRWRSDGVIEFLGRNDHQVKVRGYRIELREIEVQLEQHAGVREAVVLAPEERPGEKRLVAYVTLKHETSARELRDFLRTRLADFMLPSGFVMLDALPLTPNGKLDRKALLLLQSTGESVSETYVPPETAVERVIADTWASLLQVTRIGVHDNFFEIGGHSLSLVQLGSRLRDVFQVSLTLKQIFDHPTVAGLAQELAGLCGGMHVVEEIATLYLSMAALSDEDVRAALLQNAN